METALQITTTEQASHRMLALDIGAISQFDDRICRLSGARVESRFAVVRPVKGG
uniref:Uncharacterized protein n=1 Tax=Peronospora matthiolae TaxID=2874970 RepID=A0AAV1USR6_9STRA